MTAIYFFVAMLCFAIIGFLVTRVPMHTDPILAAIVVMPLVFPALLFGMYLGIEVFKCRP